LVRPRRKLIAVSIITKEFIICYHSKIRYNRHGAFFYFLFLRLLGFLSEFGREQVPGHIPGGRCSQDGRARLHGLFHAPSPVRDHAHRRGPHQKANVPGRAQEGDCLGPLGIVDRVADVGDRGRRQQRRPGGPQSQHPRHRIKVRGAGRQTPHGRRDHRAATDDAGDGPDLVDDPCKERVPQDLDTGHAHVDLADLGGGHRKAARVRQHQREKGHLAAGQRHPIEAVDDANVPDGGLRQEGDPLSQCRLEGLLDRAVWVAFVVVVFGVAAGRWIRRKSSRLPLLERLVLPGKSPVGFLHGLVEEERVDSAQHQKGSPHQGKGRVGPDLVDEDAPEGGPHGRSSRKSRRDGCKGGRPVEGRRNVRHSHGRRTREAGDAEARDQPTGVQFLEGGGYADAADPRRNGNERIYQVGLLCSGRASE
jgi:hypothetical protein